MESFQHGLSDLLDLIRPHPRFAELTSRTASVLLEYQARSSSMLAFKNEAHDAVLDWREKSWAIPTESELLVWESLLSNPQAFQRQIHGAQSTTGNPLQAGFSPPPEARYFSATAASIQFLGNLTKESRAHVRKVVVKENENSVCFPQSHTCGLIPFCIENSRMKIQTRIGSLVWRDVRAPDNRDLGDLFLELHEEFKERRAGGRVSNFFGKPSRKRGTTVTNAIYTWLHPGMGLHDHGMPTKSFFLFFEGPLSPMIQAQEWLQQTALLSEIYRNRFSEQSRDPKSRSL